MRLALVLVIALSAPLARAQQLAPVTFNKNFEGGSLGKIEVLGETQFRCHVEGQCDEQGHNRQASWYFFRLDHVRGRPLTITLTDFLGEYNGQPACAMNADTVPVFSNDGEKWTHFPAMGWDDAAKEATLRFTPEADSIWIAHIPPYTHSRLLALLDEIDRAPSVRVEDIGKTALGRDLHLATVTNPDVSDLTKKCVWLQARQHAWEAGTSWVMESALRFIASDDPAARALRDRVVFKFTPMLDPDGCARGGVRFNANGYDVNRHWDEVSLRSKAALALMPEIWYAKRALFACVDSGQRIDLMVNMHNTETAEYIDTLIDDKAAQQVVARLFANLKAKTNFDPSRDPAIGSGGAGSANDLWKEKRIPIVLMEQRIGTSKKLERRPTLKDREQFGRELIVQMAEAALAAQ
jgi:zinc carboxypeptidase/carboxypeptidase M14-like protein